MRIHTFAIISLFLTACSTQPLITPVEQIQQMPAEAMPTPAAEKVLAVQTKTVLYQCRDQKSVKVTRSASEKKHVTVEFNQTSHKLSSSVPKKSKKKFSNIRWIWTEEFNGSHTLRDKNGKMLATYCFKQ